MPGRGKKTKECVDEEAYQERRGYRIIRTCCCCSYASPLRYTAEPKFGTVRQTFVDAWPTQKSWTLDHQCFVLAVIKRCANFAGAAVGVWQADTELQERCQALKQRSIAVMMVERWYGGVFAGQQGQRYSNAGFSVAPLRQRPCFPHFVRGDERCPLSLPSK